MKRMASARKKSNSRSRTSDKYYAVCVANAGYTASLEPRKIYEVIEDKFGREHELVRVIDESGEDYLYPAGYFVRVELPASLQQKLRKIA